MTERIAVIGLGYVGLPVALALAHNFANTIGFDVNESRIQTLKSGIDVTGETCSQQLMDAPIRFTSDPADMAGATFFVVAVPTPIDNQKRPDLSPLITASEIVGKVLQPGAVVVYESTVYPGVTEEICGPVLEKVSGLRQGNDFKLGYSPERINPGDKEHTLEQIVKVVSGEDEETLNRVVRVYSRIIKAGLHCAPSIKVAEAAKVIENTQRDLNIALMNELAIIFDRLGIRTKDVLDAARTKWNFLPFVPGLVGGHCIGVDPYYLTMKAEEIGYYPQVILAGRRINDEMGTFLADRMVKLLIHANLPVKGARVAVLGITFKENVNDLRNSRVDSIVNELRQFGIEPMVHDPVADPCLAEQKYGLKLAQWSDLNGLDGLVLAVSHRQYLDMDLSELIEKLRVGGVLMDVKSALNPALVPDHISYWSL